MDAQGAVGEALASIGFQVYESERGRPRFGLPQVSQNPGAITFKVLYRNGSGETRNKLACFLCFLTALEGAMRDNALIDLPRGGSEVV